MYLIRQTKLPLVGMSYEFVGKDHGGAGISFFAVIGEPGRGTRLHKHDYYDEIVYVIEGRSKWKVSDKEGEASAGDILIVRAGEPHKSTNSGDAPLRQLEIHLNPTFQTIWLEE